MCFGTSPNQIKSINLQLESKSIKVGNLLRCHGNNPIPPAKILDGMFNGIFDFKFYFWPVFKIMTFRENGI